MPWELETLIIAWPPQVALRRTPGVDKALNSLFVFLEDRRLLLYGYGTRAGITDLNDLANRVDVIRSELDSALEALPPQDPITQWLGKLRQAAHELLTSTYDVIAGTSKAPSEPSDIVPAVDQLRQAFRLVAGHAWALYRLPAARNLEDQIRKDIGSPPARPTPP